MAVFGLIFFALRKTSVFDCLDLTLLSSAVDGLDDLMELLDFLVSIWEVYPVNWEPPWFLL